MIVLAEHPELLQKACDLFPASGTQIYGYFSRYGNSYPFCTTWLCLEEDGAVWGAFGRYNGALRLSCGELTPEQIGEIREFLGITGCVTLEASASAVHALFPEGTCKTGEVLEYHGALPTISSERINEAPNPDDIFPILKESDPEFAAAAQYEEWLCDAFHLCNHDAGWFCTVGKEAAAGVTALSPDYGLIGSVATVPSARGQGYASLLTGWCVRKLMERGKTPILLASDERAARLYHRIGFETTGRWAVINIE